MSPRITSLILLTLGAVVTSDRAMAQATTTYAAAEARAKALGQTRDGKAFADRVGQAFGKAHRGTVSTCAKQTPRREDVQPFHLLIQLDTAGRVTEALVRPDNTVSRCVADGVRGWAAAAPPAGDHWVDFSVNLRVQQ